MTLPHLHFTSLSPREQLGDIVDSYRWAAEALGYQTSYADRTFMPGVVNVLFFFWDVPWEVIAPYHPDCIVVNFEPMVPGTHAWRENYLGVLKQCYLWEYSQSNFQRNRELGFKVADYVSLAYEERAAPVLPLEAILPDAQQDIDVVFFGTLTARRAFLLERLLERGVRVVWTHAGTSWPPAERDDYLHRAKIALNFHNWDNSRVVEIARLSVLFRQRKAIVCELYPDSEIDPALRAAVVGAPYDALVDTIVALLANAPRRAALERTGLALFSQRPQTASVGPALSRFLQWRHQKNTVAGAGEGQLVSICLFVRATDTELARTLDAMARRTHRHIELLVFCEDLEGADIEAATRAAGVAGSVIRLPAGTGEAAAHNLALQRATGDALVFCAPGDADTPERLGRLTDFLAAHPEIDVVGHWQTLEGETLRFPELDHEIKADLLGPMPIERGVCLFSKRFLDRSGARHDTEFNAHGGFQFLCRCALAGARFAIIPEALQTHSADASASPVSAQRRAHLAMQARAPLLAALFPHLTHTESQLITQLYNDGWPPEADFAQRLLAAVGKACADAPGALGSERETLARVLRREVLRLIRVFFDAGLADQDWLDYQFNNAQVAALLAPIADQLPLRPTAAVDLGCVIPT